jgi:hypothetical protein
MVLVLGAVVVWVFLSVVVAGVCGGVAAESSRRQRWVP